MTLRPFFLLATFTLLAAQAQPQRLPSGVRPENYTLALTPDLRAATFAGQETIALTLDRPAFAITLNAAELDIQSVTADSKQQARIAFDTAKEQATFTFPETLSAGPHRLAIAFTGILNNKLRGFYLSKTKLRNYAVTQFEPTDARRAFPSFDEPALKATFSIALTVDAADTVISNGPQLTDIPASPGKHTLTFATTPKMSTYLVAFLVGDFQCSTGRADGVPIRVCGTPGKLPETRFALQAAEYILPFYDKYFGIKYPMPKLDLIGLPDFEAGAMENFGCITYRETDLFITHDAGTDARKRVASVVAHEMAHQWFGDMVTMQWWDNLWLNEGFATWMESKPVAKWHPEWNIAEDDAVSLDETLNLDAQPTTHPIRARDTETPSQINELFDGISYGKGGAVLGMVENYLGPELFRQGVHNYLAAHLYANATAEDFWNTQTATSHRPVDRIMASFIDQPGVPLLTFLGERANAESVTQTRFFLFGSPGDGNRAPFRPWVIPICLKAGAASSKHLQQTCRLLSQDLQTASTSDSIAPGPSAPFVFANAGNHGYFRTSYTPSQLQPILAAAESSLSAPERIGLLGDQYALVHSGQIPIGGFLDLVLALKQDASAAVMESLMRKLGFSLAAFPGGVAEGIATPEDRKLLESLVQREFGPVYAALGRHTANEPYNRQKLRTVLFEALGKAHDPAVLAEAQALTTQVLLAQPPTDLALADVAVNLAAESGDTAFYERLQTVAQNSPDAELRADALRSLTRFRAPILVVRTLQFAGSPAVRNQDAASLYAILLEQPETRDLAWNYIQQHWAEVQSQITTNSGTRIVAATGSFCSTQFHDEVQSFFAAHPVDAAGRTLNKALDSIADCIRRRAAEEPALHQWLIAHP